MDGSGDWEVETMFGRPTAEMAKQSGRSRPAASILEKQVGVSGTLSQQIHRQLYIVNEDIP